MHNAAALLSWVNPRLCQTVTHATTFLDARGHAVDQAKFSGKVAFPVGYLNQKQWLLKVSALLLVGFAEVLSEGDHFAAYIKLVRARGQLKVDVLNDVLALVAPVSNNAVADKLVATPSHELIVVPGLSSDLLHPLAAALGALELEDGVNHKGAAELVGLSRSLEALEDLHLLSRHVDEVAHVKELWSLTDLLQISVPESPLNNDINQALVH